MPGHPDALDVASSRWDRAAALVMVAAAVGAASMSGFDLLAVLLLSVPLVAVARALWIRRVLATAEGLRFNDGLFGHRLAWSDIDGIVVSRRSFFVQPAVQVLHSGRFVDQLPLPGGGFGRRHRVELESVASTLAGLLKVYGGASGDWCPVRIVGGLRGRMGITVAVVDATGRFEWLIAPEPRADGIAYLFRRSARRRRAETTRAEAAAARGYPEAVD